MSKLETLLASMTPAQRKQATSLLATMQAPAVTPTDSVVRCYPTLDALRALGYAVPVDATMAVLSKYGKVHYYAVAANGSREEYEEYHQPTAKHCATLRATASTTR